MTEKLSVRDIIRLGGGAPKIALASQGRGFREIGVDAVYKWQHNGIPDDHWPLMLKLTGLELSVIYDANQLVKRHKRRQARTAGDADNQSTTESHAA